jgi:hypothetical protein
MLNITEVIGELPQLWWLFFVNKKSQLLGIAGKLTLQEVMSKFNMSFRYHPYELCCELNVFVEFAPL